MVKRLLRFCMEMVEALQRAPAPFRFQRWYGGKLPIGGSEDFKVFLGQPGKGPSTFAAAKEHFLPEGEVVLATLVYRDTMGKEKRLACELKERC